MHPYRKIQSDPFRTRIISSHFTSFTDPVMALQAEETFQYIPRIISSHFTSFTDPIMAL